MPGSLIETYDSRKYVGGSNPYIEYRYVGMGYADEGAVLTAINSLSTTSSGLYLQYAEITEHINDDCWRAIARYEVPTPETLIKNSVTPNSAISFDTSGGTQHITQSFETISSHAVSGTPPDFEGAIGFDGEDVKGFDKTVPQLVYQTDCYFSQAQYESLFANWFNLVGYLNDDSFAGFEAGEVLYLGASGSKSADDNPFSVPIWKVQFKFGVSLNKTGLSVGSMTGIDKGGWDVLWVYYGNDVSNSKRIKKAVNAYVERVYDSADLTLLGIS